MAEIIRMPRLSDTMEEGNIIGWLKKVGEKVSPGDILAEVETDKATMDLESFHEGILLYIGQAEGTVPVDGIIAVIGNEGEDFEALIKEEASSTKEEASKPVLRCFTLKKSFIHCSPRRLLTGLPKAVDLEIVREFSCRIRTYKNSSTVFIFKKNCARK